MDELAGKIDTELPERQVKSSLTYLEWNNKIAEHFFNSKQAGMRVWFSVEQELIDEIAKKNGVDPSDFIKAVKQGPEGINRSKQTVCSKASAVFTDWRSKGFEYPPYISYLALFVLAVNHGENDDFSRGIFLLLDFIRRVL